jgi:cell division transport system ATP-binding protein
VWQNVAFALEVIGTRRSTIKSLVPQVLKTVGLTGKENNYPHELSGGEAQRVAIARAYVNHPQILLADEPTGNLDPTTSLGIMEVLEAINRTGTTIVMATHNEEIVNSMRKRVVELHTGKIVRDESRGSYDSAKFFPDAEVEAKAQDAIQGGAIETHALQANEIAPTPELAGAPAEADNAAENNAAVDQAIESSGQGDEGIARLANSVHSGRKGRYGEAFAPVETTLTWGKGIVLDAQHEDSGAQTGAVEPDHLEKQDDANSSPAPAAAPAPAPPVPPQVAKDPAQRAKSRLSESTSPDDSEEEQGDSK